MKKELLKSSLTKKILIIEDEGEICLLLNILLDSSELELEHVQNLSAAEQYLERAQPAVVILDNKLPDGFGVDFISYLKKTYPGVRIIMISGFSGSVRDVAIENGADIFLEKPFTRHELHQSIRLLTN
jgi:DNA-binding response OmpR family regulator